MPKSVISLFHKNYGFDLNNMMPVSISLQKYTYPRFIIQNLFFMITQELISVFLISCFRTLEQANSIDSTENLANSKVFLVHGADDTIVDPLFAKKIEAYYEGFNVDMNAKAQYIKQTIRPQLLFNFVTFDSFLAGQDRN